ncbi:DUF2637 domain-containing protein [Kribbella italica]|uniref:DUF2637 domain-containing protein n=1 Tax=Kribbella italica TaxID=1540520 RepID=A0A7W9JEV5_9ACTN|nr:DUF2637 domain-containing protein [Kribbella italica]MBB5840193.1 hypothetical protein [Kribbella italica]
MNPDTRVLNLPEWVPTEVTGPMLVAGAAGVLFVAVAVGVLVWAVRRTVRGMVAAVAAGRLTTRRVLIVVAIVAALGVAAIGGARSFGAVSEKFDSPLVPLVADGMIIACTALRLAALTRGWRIPGALVTTYVFIGGTVWLNIDTATGIADALAHALAPLAYAVLVEMLAHLLRLHMKLAEPAKPRLSALTWFTSPVITTRVWLHLSRTGADDPAAARALVQQVVRMASRLATLCPSRKLWPFDAARAARTACLQTIRDGLLTASELAALLPGAGRLTPGELLALVDSAALGLSDPGQPADRTEADDQAAGVPEHAPAKADAAPLWLVAFLIGALRSAPVQPDPAPVHPDDSTGAGPVRTADRVAGAPAPQGAPMDPDPAPQPEPEPVEAVTEEPSDADLLAAVQAYAQQRGGGPLGQQAIRRVTREAFGQGVGTGRARRLQELAGWAEPTEAAGAAPEAADSPVQTRGQLHLINPALNDDDSPSNETADNTSDHTTDRDLETSTSR